MEERGLCQQFSSELLAGKKEESIEMGGATANEKTCPKSL